MGRRKKKAAVTPVHQKKLLDPSTVISSRNEKRAAQRENEKYKSDERFKKFTEVMKISSQISIPAVFFLFCMSNSRYYLYLGGIVYFFLQFVASMLMFEEIRHLFRHVFLVVASWLIAVTFQYFFRETIHPTLLDGRWDDLELATMSLFGIGLMSLPMVWSLFVPVPPLPPWSNRAKIAKLEGDDRYDREWKKYWDDKNALVDEKDDIFENNNDSKNDDDDIEDIDLDALKEELKAENLIHELGLKPIELYSLGYPPFEGGSMDDWPSLDSDDEKNIDDGANETIDEIISKSKGNPNGKKKEKQIDDEKSSNVVSPRKSPSENTKGGVVDEIISKSKEDPNGKKKEKQIDDEKSSNGVSPRQNK